MKRVNSAQIKVVALRIVKKNYQNITECDDWGASLEYYSEIIDNASWYIKEPYRRCHISYDKFMDLLRKDD